MSIEVNGVSLPDIPSDVLEQYPYVIIASVTDSDTEGAYVYHASTAPFLYMPSALIGQDDIGAVGTTGTAVYAYGTSTIDWLDPTATEDGHTFTNGTYNGMFFAGAFEGVLVWSNHDICEAALNEAGDGFVTTSTVWFARNDSVSVSYYAAPKSWYDGMAQQVMRLSETTSKLTTDAMLSALKGVEVGGEELPNAEDAVFGIASAGYGLLMSGDRFSGAAVEGYTAGNKFTAVTGFDIVGLRAIGGNNDYTKKLCLWDSSGNLLRSAETSIYTDTFYAWYEVYFDEPYTVAAGESFVVSVYSVYNYGYSSASREVNGVVTFDQAYSISGNAFPTNGAALSSRTHGADFIIGADTEETYPAYEITRETMDAIATQVMRISGTSSTMTPAQIITALQGVT